MAKYVNLDEIDEILSCFGCPESSAEYANLVSEIDSVAPADVRPVVHGEWVSEEPNGANNFKGCYWCDQCHQPIDHKKNFCPNCGADMREAPK